MRIDIYDGLRDIPSYDDDVQEQGYPAAVQDLRTRIWAAPCCIRSVLTRAAYLQLYKESARPAVCRPTKRADQPGATIFAPVS